jgi:hypothetical protein
MALTKEHLGSLLRKNPVGVACFVLSLGIAVFAYLRSDAIPEAEATLLTNSSMVDRLNQNISNSTHLKDQYDLLLDSARKLEKRVAIASALADNQRYFYRIEASTGVKLIDLRQTPSDTVPPKGTYYKPINFTVSIQGDYERDFAFLRELENGTYVARINSVTLVPSSASQAITAETQGYPITMTINLDLVGVP